MNERNEERIIVKKAIKELAEVYGITGEEYENCNTWYDLSRLPLPESFIEKHTDEINWENISRYQKLSENFIEKYAGEVDWWIVSCRQKLSENFIEKHVDDVDWMEICICQKLSEGFMEKHTDEVDWESVSTYQQLSETFIEKHSNEIDWENISSYQKLSENFIGKHVDDVNWVEICIYQKLSEGFIEKYADKVNWICISIYQKLSENFIRKYKNELNLHDIARHQVISLKFAKELGVADVFLRHNNCLKPISYWKKAVKNTGLYECHKDYFYAYKGIRSDRYSCRNFQYQYLPGGTYGCFSDYSNAENSFGLSAWTKEDAEKYCNELVIKVKIYYEDVTAVVHDGGKIRCKKMTVLD